MPSSPPTSRWLAARFETVEALFEALALVPRDTDGRLRVVSEGSGERVWLPGDATGARGHWTIPLPDIHFDEELRFAVGQRGDG